jgi:hypothetical protein
LEREEQVTIRDAIVAADVGAVLISCSPACCCGNTAY